MNFATVLHRRFEADGVGYVYATPSASILRLDAVSDEILAAFSAPGGADPGAFLAERSGRADVAEFKVTLEEMVSIGLVRPVGEAAPPAPKLPPMPFPLATLVLNVTNKCNLSCTYCYEYGEDRIAEAKKADGTKKATMMSPETARTSVDFLFRSSPGRGGVSITFFGGETLLNFATIEAAVLHAEEIARRERRGVGFSLTTNATLLSDAVIDFLVAHRFGVNVSIDGPREDHDRHRSFKSGLGSYEQIVPKIRRLIEQNRAARGRPIGARVTLTAGMTGVRRIYEHLVAELGFDEVGFAPVTSAPGRGYALSDENYDQVLREFAELAEDYVATALRGEHHGFSNLNDLLRELHQGLNKAHPCGAGLGLLGVSTEGELGLCHRFVESGAHEVGNVVDGIDAARRREFLERGHIATKIACHDCFARPLCSGGCYHEAYVRYRDASQPNLHYCEWIRGWTDLGLRSYARIANHRPDFLDALIGGASATSAEYGVAPERPAPLERLAPSSETSP